MPVLGFVGTLDCFLAHAMVEENSLSMLLHPFHHSLGQEFEACIAVGKENEDIWPSQYEYYLSQQGFIDDQPHVAGDLIDRQAGDPYVVNLMERWFDQLIKWSRRDQVAFNYSRSYFPDDTVNDLAYYENILTNSITERFQHIG